LNGAIPHFPLHLIAPLRCRQINSNLSSARLHYEHNIAVSLVLACTTHLISRSIQLTTSDTSDVRLYAHLESDCLIYVSKKEGDKQASTSVIFACVQIYFHGLHIDKNHAESIIILKALSAVDQFDFVGYRGVIRLRVIHFPAA
jgi:hypothetical protein